MPISQYLNNINSRFKTGIATEHTYRGDLQTLLETLAPGVMATNEPARIKCGAPDYIITKKDIPIGYIEAKDIGKPLDSKDYKEQFDRYRKSLSNLIITDYLDFRFYRDGAFVTSIRIADAVDGKIIPKADHIYPWIKGGQTDVENAQVLCKYHNASKGAKDMAEMTAR